jgi:hypothetical protein
MHNSTVAINSKLAKMWKHTNITHTSWYHQGCGHTDSWFMLTEPAKCRSTYSGILVSGIDRLMEISSEQTMFIPNSVNVWDASFCCSSRNIWGLPPSPGPVLSATFRGSKFPSSFTRLGFWNTVHRKKNSDYDWSFGYSAGI